MNTPKEKIVVGGALIGGIIFFGFLTGTCKNPLSHLRSISTDQSADHSSANAEIVARNTELQSKLDAALSTNSDLNRTAMNLECLKQQNAALSAKLNEALSQQDALSKQLLLQQTHTHLSNPNTLANAQAELKRQVTLNSLTNQKLEALNAILMTKESNNKQLRAELSSTKNQLTKAMAGAASHSDSDSSSNNKSTAAKTAELNDAVKELTKQNANLQAGLAVSKTNLNDLNRTIDAFRTISKEKDQKIEALSANLNQLKAKTSLFVKSADDLPDNAKSLFADIKTLEGKSQADIAAAYKVYASKHHSTAKARIKFSSGSSTLTADDIAKIKQLTASAGKNAYFLVVGFADQSGSAASNESLSSKRSTSVAKELAENAKGFQAAQAVYLGQTSRFGAPAENRVVEIWQIK